MLRSANYYRQGRVVVPQAIIVKEQGKGNTDKWASYL